MISMPISDYPASSDPSSQMQVLSERKGEISEKIQNVEDSSLDERKKNEITDSLQQSSDNLSAQIRHKRVQKDDQKKLDENFRQKQSVENKQLQKQDGDNSNSKSRIDIRV